MSEELDRRAARAMGWTIDKHATTGWDRITDNDGRSFWLITWKPSTDRNDLAELLKEVERRGLAADMVDEAADAWMKSGTLDGMDMSIFWFLVADPAIICEAACKVLEATNA